MNLLRYPKFYMAPDEPGAGDSPPEGDKTVSAEDFAKVQSAMAEQAISIQKLTEALKKERESHKTATQKLKDAEKVDLLSKEKFEELLEAHKTDSLTLEEDYKTKLADKDKLIRDLTIGNAINESMADKVLPSSRAFIEWQLKDKLDVDLTTGEVFVKGAEGTREKFMDKETKAVRDMKPSDLFNTLYSNKEMGVHFRAPDGPAGSGAGNTQSPGITTSGTNFENDFKAKAEKGSAEPGSKDNIELYGMILGNQLGT